MSPPLNHPWQHRFAVFTAAATLLLLAAGGLVTSHGVGMAVPDWPNTYGYNMFFFPISRWAGGIFYEHTHRLMASGVGLLTGILALWLYGKPARPFMRWTGLGFLVLGLAGGLLFPGRWADGVVAGSTGLVLFGTSFVWPRCEPAVKWLRRLGWIAFVAVVLQGVLGGLRVVWFKDQIGVFHATLAQLFFALTCAMALFTSKWWRDEERWSPIRRDAPSDAPGAGSETGAPKLRGLLLFTTCLILFQLMLGAMMRHQHAGLAIPDFPLAYGKLWPATDPKAVAHYNGQRVEVTAANPITAFQIHLQMGHRLVAALILAGVAGCAWRVRSAGFNRSASPNLKCLSRLAAGWLALVLAQVALGAWTIWSNKAADVATAHVLVGALSLATGSMLCLVSFRSPEWAHPAPVRSAAASSGRAGDGLLAARDAAAQPS
jgi:heme a synthase